MAAWSRLSRRLEQIPIGARLKRTVKLAVSPSFRRQERAQAEQFLQFERAYGPALRHRLLSPPRGNGRKALVVSSSFLEGVRVEVGLVKALERANFEPVVLMHRDQWLSRYFRLAGVHRIVYWDQYLPSLKPPAIQAVMDRLGSSEALLAFEHEGVRAGKFAASTALRASRVGSLDLSSPSLRSRLAPHLASSIAAVEAARAILQAVAPSLVLFVDRGYTPQGQLFDVCLTAGIDAVTWNTAHTNRALVFKRYTPENRDDHPVSLSPASWGVLRRMGWGEEARRRLHEEIRTSYTTGAWCSEVGTQFNKAILEAEELRRQLGLDPGKKTAVIFPHILWDGTFFWGTDVFDNYEAWLLETVRAACANKQVNWVIKLHPANVVKNARDGLQQESTEASVLKRSLGRLPGHVVLIPPETDINTYSLFQVMDYCLTVRGTIGIEAASFGIPVLTAGTGRYDRKGFTIDSASVEEYLARLATIQQIPPLSPQQRELAERFAYGVFLLRPLPFSTMTIEYQRDARATCTVRINAATKEDWCSAPDLNAFAAWAVSKEADFLLPLPDRGAADMAHAESLPAAVV